MKLRVTAAGAAMLFVSAAVGQWTQWGGPQRDFICRDVGKLAASWPADGPKKLWSREIGDGYSCIVSDGESLITMCRRGDEDAVLAVDPASGQTRWETRYPAPIPDGFLRDFGLGPQSTPLIVGERVFTMGATIILHGLDRKSGRVLWKHDLMSELDAPHLGRGYGASPIAYKDLVIVNAGAPGAAVVAFRQDNGEIVWKSGDFGSTYTSPVLGQLDDKDVLIVAMGNHRAGLDPATGAVRWSHEVDRKMRTTMSTPIWGDDGILFTSSAYDGETQVFRVAGSEGAYGVEQLWSHRKMRVHFGNAVRVGDFVYGSSGDFGPSFLMCADLKTGELKWRSREVGKSTLLSLGGGRMLLLDEDGNLALADCTPEGVKIQSKAKLLENQAWTVPTLIGTKLYLRDRKTMMAVELGA